MKALIVDAEWQPRKNYPICEEEKTKKRAIIGSQVWRNTTFNIKDVPTPNPADDEVLIKVKSCGICGSDTHLYETDEEGYVIFSGLTKLPCIIGHEFSGIVEKAGRNVRSLERGDKVAVESIMWCGRCQSCRSGFPNQCKHIELMGLSADGAFAEYAAVSERYCWKINDLMHVHSEEDAFDIGALIEPVGCAYNGIFIVGGGFNPGAIVVVYGAGPIGLGAVALARIAGASQIIAFDILDERVKIAKDMGADRAFNVNKLDGRSPADKVMELTKGYGADIQVEAAGAATKTIPEMERSMAVNGKIIYLGRAATSTTMHLDMLVSGANKIIGSRGHSGYGIFPCIIKLIAAGKLNLERMITARYTFQNIMDAIRASSNRTNGKILIKM
ncbi:MAG: alcohol dehydrogenase catalytic domain-containing protein [Planctomycetes bacterium]|nr:alcohol dehydrogenase catalytic domain-containing protein [Planctomycetota bacterium]